MAHGLLSFVKTNGPQYHNSAHSRSGEKSITLVPEKLTKKLEEIQKVNQAKTKWARTHQILPKWLFIFEQIFEILENWEYEEITSHSLINST